MTFLIDVQELKPGLIIFRRSDVKHRNWYCRIRIPKEDRYKTISLKTTDINEAKRQAFDHDAEVRFRVKHNVPIFEKSFAQVAAEYTDFQKSRADAGDVTRRRWKIVESHTRLHLIPYIGNLQVTMIGEDKWRAYPLWRKQRGHPKDNGPPAEDAEPAEPIKNGTIRQEMMTFRAIMSFAASRQYIQERQVPKGRLPADKARREEFTPQEYRQLHRAARKWVDGAPHERSRWYRTMVYNYMLIMTNTGMRTIEAQNLRWRDIDLRSDSHGRSFVCINVRGKDKFRELVAAHNVASYLERIRAVSKATAPDDFVFSTYDGKAAMSHYKRLIQSLLTESGLLYSASGSRRSAYCFRHTYATFRLTEGVDVYFLAKQMGTSVKMIEDYYGHITPAKNAEQILQGIPGWEPVEKTGNTSRAASAPAESGRSKRRKKTRARPPKAGRRDNHDNSPDSVS